MPQKWRKVDPVASTSTIATNFSGLPIMGPLIETTNLPRVLVGWNHQDDTPDGLMHGQLFCTVFGGRKFMVFNTSGNRSKQPGVVVFCGAANFTMIRMFPPYWAEAGPHRSRPRDMAWLPKHPDKATLRGLYFQFLRDNDIPAGYDEPTDPPPAAPDTPSDDHHAATAEANDDDSLFVRQDEGQRSASPSSVEPSRRPGRPTNPKKNPKVRRQKVQKSGSGYANRRGRKKGQTSLLVDDPDSSSDRDLATLDDGDPKRSESRASSLVNNPNHRSPFSTQPARNTPNNLDASPGRNAYHAVEIDLDELQDAVDEQRREFSSSRLTSDPAQEFVNEIDDEDDTALASGRLLAEFRGEYFKRGNSNINKSISPRVSNSSRLPSSPQINNGGPTASYQLSNGGVLESVELDETKEEQDAQVPSGGNMTLVNDDEDLQMIEEDVKELMDEDVIEVVSALAGRGTTQEDAIMID